MGILGLLAAIFPEKGIHLGGKEYRFISISDVFSSEGEKIIDVEALVQKRQDSLASQLRLAKKQQKDSIAKNTSNPLRIQYGSGSSVGLDKFFEALYQQQNGKGKVRVLHYGDSQIEEDRISGYIRSKLQAKFGGGGVGLLSASTITNSQNIGQSFSENWLRITAFGGGSKAPDGRYGAMAIMCRYATALSDSSSDSTLITKTYHNGSITLTRRGGFSSGNYNHVRIFTGYNTDSVTITLSYQGITDKKILPPNASFQTLDFSLSAAPNQLKINFEGKRSPEVYGISLERENGVVVDNISMRGASGTMFYKLNTALTSQMYQELAPQLIIFQYGGNVMPYIQTKKEAENFAKAFKSNIQRIQKMNPNASILVIGPSDMSKKINGTMQTYPILTTVRDAMKRVTQELGGGYFDLYEVMGGLNSMPSWVSANPALAAKDYIHFSPKGANKIAELLYEALMLDYETYVLHRSKK